MTSENSRPATPQAPWSIRPSLSRRVSHYPTSPSPSASGAEGRERRYALAGREVVADLALTELEPIDGAGAPSIVVKRDPSPYPEPAQLLREVDHPELGAAWLRVRAGDEGVQWAIHGLGRFWVLPSGAEVRYDPAEGADPRDLEQALIGPVLGTALRLGGLPLLHASAVALDGRAIALSAPSGAGKSTLSAALIRGGASLLSDDALALEERADGYEALPYLPRLKLWADTVRAFEGDEDEHQRVVSWAAKRRVPVGGTWGRPAEAGAPLARVYLLDPSSEPPAPEIHELTAVEAALALQAAMYPPDLQRSQYARQSLATAAAIARRVPVCRLSYQRSFESLPIVASAIRDDLDARGAAS